MKSKRSQACSFSPKAKKEIFDRDRGRCIVCQTAQALTYAHYLSRNRGGLGIVHNGVLLCLNCHHRTDHTVERKMMLAFIKNYLISKHDDWNEDALKYSKSHEPKRFEPRMNFTQRNH